MLPSDFGCEKMVNIHLVGTDELHSELHSDPHLRTTSNFLELLRSPQLEQPLRPETELG